MYVPAYMGSASLAASFGSRSNGRPIKKGAAYVPAPATLSVVGVARPPKAPSRRPGRPRTPSFDSSSPAKTWYAPSLNPVNDGAYQVFAGEDLVRTVAQSRERERAV